MDPLEHITRIELWEGFDEIGLHIEPPMTDNEFDALDWTGAGEQLLRAEQPQIPRTILSQGRIDPVESPIAGVHVQHFVIRVFADQIKMLRELQGQEAVIIDRLPKH